MTVRRIAMLIILNIIILGTFFAPIRYPEDPSGVFNENRLLVHASTWTGGAEFVIEKGQEKVKTKLFRDVDKTGIHAVGDTTYLFICTEEFYFHKYILYGKFEGFKNIDGEQVPVFVVDKWSMTDYLPIFFCNKITLYLFLFSILIFLVLLVKVIVILIKWLIVKRKIFK